MKYVCGFYFVSTHAKTHSNCHVALVKKAKPEWQKGKLNGIGGKVEDDLKESPLHAMVREFEEETGLKTLHTDWKQICCLNAYNKDGENATIYFMKAFSDTAYSLKSLTPNEEISYHSVNKLQTCSHLMLPNLRWLIPMALYADELVPPILQEKEARK